MNWKPWHNEHRAARATDELWDNLVQQHSAPRISDVPEARIIRQLHRAADRAALTPAFEHQLLEKLLGTFNEEKTSMNAQASLPPAGPWGTPLNRRENRSFLPAFQIAAVIVLVFGAIGALWLTAGRWTSNNPQTPAALSVAASPEASPQVGGVINAPIVWQTGSDTGFGTDPGPLVVDSTGKIYWADYLNNRIAVIDASGTRVEYWGEPGSGPGQFNFVLGASGEYGPGLGIDADDNLYVFDIYNSRVQKFDSSHAFIKEWGAYGIANGEFDQPRGSVDPVNDRVVVTDARNNRLQVFDLEGTFLDRIGSSSTLNLKRQPGYLLNPIGIAFAPDGSMYVVEEGRLEIQHFDPYGVYLGTLQLPEGGFGALGIAVDSNGNVFVCTIQAIQVYEPGGQLIGSIPTPQEPGQNPWAYLAIDQNDDLYVSLGGDPSAFITKLDVPDLQSLQPGS